MGARVLIVDDEPDTGTMLQHMLRAASYRADAVTTALEALGVMRAYDILVTDFRLGRKGVSETGMDLAKVYKRVRPDGYVILLSGFNDLMCPYVDVVFTKPINIERLLSAMRHRILPEVEREPSRTAEPV